MTGWRARGRDRAGVAAIWERVGSGSGANWGERLTKPIHEQIEAALRLGPGQEVLDIGCGDGAYFPTLREGVGPQGRVHGVDASQNMVARAQERIAAHDWPNVTVEQADFTRIALEPRSYDAALAVFAFSAMPDVGSAVQASHRALRPGGRLFIVDLRLRPRGVTAPLIHLARMSYRFLAGWSGVDVLDTVRTIFPTVDVRRGEHETWPPVTVLTATSA